MSNTGSSFDDFLKEQGLLEQCRNEAIAQTKRRTTMTKFTKVMTWIGILVLTTVVAGLPFLLNLYPKIDVENAIGVTILYCVWIVTPYSNWIRKHVETMKEDK